MTDDATGDLDMDRRTFLKSAGALGISASAIDLISEDEAQIGDITYNPQEEVPYVAGWENTVTDTGGLEREPFYDKMSIEEWDKLEAVDRASEKLNNYLSDEFDEISEPVTIVESADNNSPVNRRLDIELRDENITRERVEDSLPETFSGEAEIQDLAWEIPIGVRNSDVNLHNQCGGTCDENSCYDSYPEYDNIPGGAPIGETHSDVGIGMLTGAYYAEEHGYGWVTAAHVVDNENGVDIYQMPGACEIDSALPVGTSVETYFDDAPVDVALIDEDSTKDAHPWIASLDYTENEQFPVKGEISNTKLQEELDNSDWGLHLQGQYICRVRSYPDELIKKGSEIVAVSLDDAYGECGDSGGPFLHFENGDAYIAGTYHGPENGKDSATTAEKTDRLLDGGFVIQS